MTVLLSLGTNLGDRPAYLNAAVAELRTAVLHSAFTVAPVYETAPVDVPDEYKALSYLNTAVVIETDLSPENLSDIVHAIEDRLGRVRTGYHSPRTVDIDLIACGDEIRNTPELTLPHPRASERRFVLQPLADICPDFILPGQSRTIAELLALLPPGQECLRAEG